jgi:signal transduction histidine kinase
MSQANQLRLAEQRSVLANAARQFEHVLSNRLGGIGNRLNDLKSDLAQAVPDAGRRRELLDQIETMQDRLEQLDQRSRRAVLYMRAPEIQAVEVEKLWARVAADMADKAKKHAIQVDCPASHATCLADPEILYNILLILLDNALDALHGRAGGRVWLELRAQGENLEITVADNGPGVSHGIRKRLFVEEGTTSKGSLGVALFLARQRARVMDGDLGERGEGQGARFVLRLPIGKKNA